MRQAARMLKLHVQHYNRLWAACSTAGPLIGEQAVAGAHPAVQLCPHPSTDEASLADPYDDSEAPQFADRVAQYMHEVAAVHRALDAHVPQLHPAQFSMWLHQAHQWSLPLSCSGTAEDRAILLAHTHKLLESANTMGWQVQQRALLDEPLQCRCRHCSSRADRARQGAAVAPATRLRRPGARPVTLQLLAGAPKTPRRCCSAPYLWQTASA